MKNGRKDLDDASNRLVRNSGRVFDEFDKARVHLSITPPGSPQMEPSLERLKTAALAVAALMDDAIQHRRNLQEQARGAQAA